MFVLIKSTLMKSEHLNVYFGQFSFNSTERRRVMEAESQNCRVLLCLITISVVISEAGMCCGVALTS